MPSTFAATSTRMWSAALRSCSVDARLLRAYIATAPTKTTEGLFPLPIGYASHDTGLSETQIEQAFEELRGCGLVDWDPDTDLVLDREALVVTKYGDDSDKRIKGAVKLIEGLPPSPLVAELVALAERFAPAIARALTSTNAQISRDEFRGVSVS
jgi:hypothetical protein